MSAIEGIPEGYELARIGAPRTGEPYLTPRGRIDIAEGNFEGCGYAVLRKVEKPKQYRPFANGDEFEPFRDRWFCPKIKRNHLIKTSAYNEHRHWSGEEPDTWEKMFDEYVFDDGTPFGIEVTE